MKRCIAQYALNLFCITEQGEHIGGGGVKSREMSGKREGCREGFSHFLQCCALKVGRREREKLHELTTGDYS